MSTAVETVEDVCLSTDLWKMSIKDSINTPNGFQITGPHDRETKQRCPRHIAGKTKSHVATVFV